MNEYERVAQARANEAYVHFLEEQARGKLAWFKGFLIAHAMHALFWVAYWVRMHL